MTSDEERRGVARNLREIEERTLLDVTDGELIDLLAEAVDLDSYEGEHSEGGLLYCLADLIEPEPERTCRMTKKGPEFVLAGWWECSECGPVYPPCNDDIAIWALQKCPRCGAKVVDDD